MLGVRRKVNELVSTFRDIAQENERLKADNAKLREDRDRYKVMFESVHATAGELHRVRYEWKRDREQNAKLRELAVRAYKTARMMCEAWDGPCQSNSDVPSWRVPCPTDERDEQCVFGQLERDMRELGMEV